MTEPGSPAPVERWWSNDEFWDELFEFMFPPEHIAWGAQAAELARALVGAQRGDAVLDLGCGFGRVSVPLARSGVRVTGVDLHAGFLAHAREWAAREGVPAEFVQGDIAAVALSHPFDAVLSVFNSFGYFADPAQDRRVIESAFRALRPGGRFLLEAAHRDGVVRTMHVRERTGDDRHRLEEPRLDPVSGILETRWTVTKGDARKVFSSRSRPYSATELRDMLTAAGFEGIRFQADLHGSPASLDSYMIVALAERPG